ncbi:hypothetical protein WL18_21435 [Burkholderia ubonensis]|nr:hypothetical protein WI74_02475 [Burkholderia ubonensis]KVZ40777.1 hypothetical protein WL18_21435 [Burkholderia ubonensis]KWF06104.1 hypothetical protein WL83_26935 [Burkholderia ubonensis]KWN84895.1 hypothetical protein WM25_02410 [Burkholderia ubonensis]
MNHHEHDDTLCDDDTMRDIARLMDGPDDDALVQLGAALAHWPGDHRLWFLRGSIYAGQQRRDEARADFARTIVLAPDFDIARFMLGVADLLDGRVQEAAAVWATLDERLSQHDALWLFKTGLLALCDDRFDAALDWLKQGLAVNQRYPVIDGYIEQVIAHLETMTRNGDDKATGGHLLLSGYLASRTRH